MNVDVYVNSDHSKFFLNFFSWGDDMQVVGITFDGVSFFTAVVPLMWALADLSAWFSVE